MKRILPPVIIVLGIALSFGVYSLLLRSLTRSWATVDLTTQLAGLSLADLQEGTDAIAAVTELHRQKFLVDVGAMGIYGDREMIVWVASAALESIALEMTNAMQHKIAEGNSPFTLTDERDSSNRKVYTLERMGQRH